MNFAGYGNAICLYRRRTESDAFVTGPSVPHGGSLFTTQRPSQDAVQHESAVRGYRKVALLHCNTRPMVHAAAGRGIDRRVVRVGCKGREIRGLMLDKPAQAAPLNQPELGFKGQQYFGLSCLWDRCPGCAKGRPEAEALRVVALEQHAKCPTIRDRRHQCCRVSVRIAVVLRCDRASRAPNTRSS